VLSITQTSINLCKFYTRSVSIYSMHIVINTHTVCVCHEIDSPCIPAGIKLCSVVCIKKSVHAGQPPRRNTLTKAELTARKRKLMEFILKKYIKLLTLQGKSVLWRAGYTPGDRLTSWVYSTTFIQYL
jgi:hypothetical protein